MIYGMRNGFNYHRDPKYPLILINVFPVTEKMHAGIQKSLKNGPLIIRDLLAQ